MPVSRVQAIWNNTPGGTGRTSIYFFDLRGNETAGLTAVRTFFDQAMGLTATHGFLPSAISITMDPLISTFDENTGDLLAVTPGTPGAAVNGEATQAYSAASGAWVNWLTNGIHGNRRVRGRSFLVPLSSIAFEPNGTLLGTTITEIQTAAATFIASASGPAVWARPKEAVPPSAEDPDGEPARPGAVFAMTAAQVPDKAGVLRSRRD